MTRISLFFSLIILISCGETSKKKKTIIPDTLFSTLNHKETGVNFRNDLHEDLSSIYSIYYFEYFYNGAGISVGDINNDNLPDLFFSSNNSQNKLYLNLGDMKFKDITKSAGINKNKNWSTGTVMADVNNDGYMDIYVCQGGPKKIDKAKRKNLLFINNANQGLK